MRDFNFKASAAKLLTNDIVNLLGYIHEYKGQQNLFVEAKADIIQKWQRNSLPFLFSSRSGQLFYPIEAITFDNRGDSLEHLICIQAGDNRYGMPMEYECCKERERQNYAPDADKIHSEHIFRVASASDDSRVGWHLIRRADRRHRKHR